MGRSRIYPDGTLELDWSADGREPGTSAPGAGPAAWCRLDGGPWLPVTSDQSAYAAWDRIRDCGTAAEALARLRPGGGPPCSEP